MKHMRDATYELDERDETYVLDERDEVHAATIVTQMPRDMHKTN